MYDGSSSQQRAAIIVAELEALNRVLSDQESAQLQRALRTIYGTDGCGPRREVWHWSAKEDRKLILLIKKRGYSLRIKPFQRNDEVQRIAQEMNRTYDAVLKRIQRLRKQMGK